MKFNTNYKPKSKFVLILEYILMVVVGIITVFWTFVTGICVFQFIKTIIEGSELGIVMMLLASANSFVIALFFCIFFVRAIMDLRKYHKFKNIQQ